MTENSSFFLFIHEAFSRAHPALRLVLMFFLMFTSLLIFSVIGMLVAMPVFSLGWNELFSLLQNNLKDASPELVKFFQTVQSIGLFLLPGMFLPMFILRKEEDSKSGLPRGIIALLILGTIVFSIPIINFLIHLNNQIIFPESMSGIEKTFQQLENEAQEITQKLIMGASPWQLIVNLMIVAVLPAFGEEFIFRRIMQPLFASWFGKPHLAIILTALIFSAVHGQFYGFLPRFVLGLYFGYLFYWTGNIYTAVWAHFLNNGIAVFVVYLYENNSKLSGYLGGEDNAISLAVLAFASVGVGLQILATLRYKRTSRA